MLGHQKFPIKLIVANVQERFMQKLKGITEPETKRKIIGEEFIRVFEEIANESGARISNPRNNLS